MGLVGAQPERCNGSILPFVLITPRDVTVATKITHLEIVISNTSGRTNRWQSMVVMQSLSRSDSEHQKRWRIREVERNLYGCFEEVAGEGVNINNSARIT